MTQYIIHPPPSQTCVDSANQMGAVSRVKNTEGQCCEAKKLRKQPWSFAQ